MISLLSRRSIQGLSSLAIALCLALTPATVSAKGGFSSSSSHSHSSSSSSSSSKSSSSGGSYGSPSLGSSSKSSSSSSSGGYGSPSMGSSSSSKPSSSSGGYGSPSQSTTAPAAGGSSVSGLGSANDKAVSQQSSKSSLDAYKASKAPAAAPTTNWQPRPDVTWSRPSYVPVTPTYYGSGSSGINGMVWWMMLDNLADHAVMATLMSHRNSDDYYAWRREADRQAATNAELRARLDEMDRKLAAEGPQANAMETPEKPKSHTLRNVLLIVLIGGGLYGAYRYYSRRRV